MKATSRERRSSFATTTEQRALRACSKRIGAFAGLDLDMLG
jgi:hypothetical protein